MTYKKVTPISKGVLRIRSEPDESGRVCGSVSYGDEVTVETTKVTSKKGKEYYRLAGYGYILASQVRDAESQTETECSGCSGQESGISSEKSRTGSKGV